MGKPYTFAPSGLLVSAEMNETIDYALSQTRGITTVQLAARAGIVSGQLADRFAPFNINLLLLQRLGVAATLYDLNTGPQQWVMPAAQTEFARIYFGFRPGKAAFITRIRTRVNAIGGAGNGRVWYVKNGTQTLGAGQLDVLLAGTNYDLGNAATPFDNPITTLQHNDFIQVDLGRTGGAATMQGLYINIAGKAEIGA